MEKNVFVITGGGSGIGRALAIALAKRGYAVTIIGRRLENLQQTAAVDSKIAICCADVASRQGRDCIVEALRSVKTIQGLIHNAGMVEPIALIGDIAEDAWEQVMATNLHAPLFLTQRLRAQLNKSRVLHMGSGVAYFPVIAWSPYCVSKAGLAMLTRCCQLEMDPEVTAVTSVMPGIIDTDMQNIIRHASVMHPKKLAFFQRLYAENKLISPETVAEFLVWMLLSLPTTTYISKEWDIYDKTHHQHWLRSPHTVPFWEQEAE